MKQLLALLLICTPYVLCAQIQRGYVRTAGNENEKGQVLEGVLIRAEGLSPVVSDKNGIFTLALPNIESDGDAFRIISVRKSNFELLNKDALNAQFTYSASVPIEIVMISSELLSKKREEIEEKARKNATERYEQKLKNLREQLANLQITTKEYDSKIRQLQEQMESFEKLILTMAEHYARTDYDNLDPLNAEINRCIVAGELERADSLINTKGDIIERAYENIKKGKAIRQLEIGLEKVRQNIEDDKKSALE